MSRLFRLVFPPLALAVGVTTSCDPPPLDDATWKCATDADCGPGFLCDTSIGGCVESAGEGEGEGGSCAGDADCGQGTFCNGSAVCEDLGPTSDDPGVDATSIHVGLTAALQTGPREEGTAFAGGLRAAFAERNAAGGVRNRQLVLHALDDGANPTTAAANVAQLVEAGGDKESFAIVAGSTQVASAARDAAVAANRLFLAGRGGNDDIYGSFNRLVFATRPSLEQETENALRYFISNGDLRVPLDNFALLAEAESSAADAALTPLGAEVQAALQAQIDRRVLPPAVPPEAQLLRYAQGSQDMDTAVESAIQWLGSGAIEANEVGSRPVVFALAATSRPAGAFVEAMLDAFHDLKLGRVAGSAFGLSDQELTRLQNVQDLYFYAPAEVGLDTLNGEVTALGTYTTVAGEVEYCSRIVSTQVVPEVAPGSSADAYVTALAAVDASAVPSRAGFEGYVAGRALIAALEAVAPAIDTDALVTALESMPAADFGSGSIDFTASSHVGAEDLYGVGFDTACSIVDLDLDLPDQPPPVSECPGGVCLVQGVLFGQNNTNVFRMRAAFEYLLKGTVFVGDDSSETILQIEPGTVIKGDFETTGTLVIRRGSKIVADGTEASPILFTSEKAPGQRATGDWGGIVINGRAPVNCNAGVQIAEGTTDASGSCQGIGEGASGLYGGADDSDDSGVLRYVRVEYAGKKISDATTGAENELNGIAFQGVGRSTVVDFVHVHRGQDDGIEFFGGTVDAKHLIITCADDDSLDWVGGYRGRIQYAVVQQCDGRGDNGIEADNRSNNASGSGNNLLPRSRPMLANLTMIGLNSADAAHSTFGALLRQGTHATIANSVFMGFNKDCLDIDQTATFTEAATVDANGDPVPTGALSFAGTILSCSSPFEEEAGDLYPVGELFAAAGAGNTTVPLSTQIVVSPYTQVDAGGNTPRFAPAGGSPLLGGAQTFVDVYEADAGAFFDDVAYRGAVDPADDWTRGWARFEEN